MFFEFDEDKEGVAPYSVDYLEGLYVAVPLRKLHEPLNDAFHFHFLKQNT